MLSEVREAAKKTSGNNEKIHINQYKIYTLWVLSLGTSIHITVNPINFWHYVCVFKFSVWFWFSLGPFVRKIRGRAHTKKRVKIQKKTSSSIHRNEYLWPFFSQQERKKEFKAWLMKLAINGILMSPWDSFILFILLRPFFGSVLV